MIQSHVQDGTAHVGDVDARLFRVRLARVHLGVEGARHLAESSLVTADGGTAKTKVDSFLITEEG